MWLPWWHSCFQYLSVKNQISPFVTFLSGTEGLARNTHGSHVVLILPIGLLGVDDPCLRTFAPIVSVHPYCARKFTCHVMHQACTLTLRDVKEPTHYSKRAGDVVPGDVVYLHLHHHSARVGKVQWAHKNGLIAAAIGALSMLTSEPTAKSNVKKTGMFVLSLSRHYISKLHLATLYYVSTAAVTCCSDALENQHSTYLVKTIYSF